MLIHARQPEKALALADTILKFLRSNRYHRYEAQLMLMVSRGLEGLGRYDEGRKLSEDGLRLAESAQDAALIAFALENLGGIAVTTGDLPLAASYRARGADVNRRQDNLYVLPFELTNLAEVLIRLGRGSEASPLFAELDTNSGEAFRGRQRRATALKALRATIAERYPESVTLADELLAQPPAGGDSSARLAAGLRVYARARQKQPISRDQWHAAASAFRATSPEPRYWSAYALLLSGKPREGLDGALEALASKSVTASPELEWRLAAVAARACAPADARRVELAARATRSLDRLRAMWKGSTAAYEARSDLAELITFIDGQRLKGA